MPADQARLAQARQHPVEDLLVNLQREPFARARQRRVVGSRFPQRHAQEAAQAQRVAHPPGDAALGADSFEVAHEETTEVDPRRNRGPPHRGRVGRGAQLLGEAVKARGDQRALQRGVEGMLQPLGKLSMGDKELCLQSLLLTHRHETHRQRLQRIDQSASTLTSATGDFCKGLLNQAASTRQ